MYQMLHSQYSEIKLISRISKKKKIRRTACLKEKNREKAILTIFLLLLL